ncbi:MAG: protein BatD [Sphingobacteriales bacterium]|nr:MAG: protein BatD [Sphingobacteriales bacterium]
MLRAASFLTLLLLLAFHAGAQVTFRAELLYDEVGVNTAFQVQYNLENAGELVQMTLDPAPPFSSIGNYADAQRTSTQIINGSARTTRTYTRSYTLRASKTGTFTVPVAVAQTTDGSTYRSSPATVKVVSGNPRTANRQAPDPFGPDPFGGMDPFGPDPFGNGGANPFGPGSPLDRIADAFGGQQRLPTIPELRQLAYLEIVPQKQTAFIGEPILVEYRLVSGITVNGNLNKIPAPDGFWVQELTTDREERSTKQVGNRLFQTLLIKRVALIPQRAGKLLIEPAEMQAVTNVADANGAPQRYSWAIKSAPSSLVVSPLPPTGKPASFNGAVGQYQVAASLEPATMPQNGSSALRITVSGEGNLPQLEAPSLSLPDGLSAEEAVVQDAFKTDGKRLLGSRTFIYPLTASQERHFTIPALSVSFFNPQSAAYQTIQTTPQTLTVTAPEALDELESAGSSRPLLWGLLGLAVAALLIGLRMHRKTPPVPKPIPKPQPVSPDPIAPLTNPVLEPPLPAPVPATLPELQAAIRVLVRQKSTRSDPTAEQLIRSGLDALTAQQLPVYLARAEAARYGGLPVDESTLLEEGRYLLQRLIDWSSTPSN